MGNNHVFMRFLKKLEVPYTNIYTSSLIEDYPYKYTLYGLSKLLKKYKVENECFRLKNKTVVKSLQTPFIADVLNDFVIVDLVSSSKIEYDWHGKKISVTYDEFLNQWSGIILLAYPCIESSEPKYKEHLKDEIITRSKRYLLIVFLLFFIASGVFVNRNLNLLYFIVIIIDAIGIYVSFLLLKKQLHFYDYTAERLCGILKKGNCDDLLETKASKFIGIFGWSEIGLTFFIVNLLTFIFFPQFTLWLVCINICALPYTLWSIWYQKYKANIWCPLCLITQLLIWLSLVGLIGYEFSKKTIVGIPNICYLQIFAYPLVLLAINALIPLMTSANQVELLKYKLNSFKIQKGVFENLLVNQPVCDISENSSSLLFGDLNAKFRITIFSNPYCNPCAKLHKRLEAFVGAECCIQYILNYFSDDLAITNKYLIAAYKTYGCNRTWKILGGWFEADMKMKSNFFKDMHLVVNSDFVEREFKNHREWKDIYKFTATPTILINGRVLPRSYQIEDILYFI